MEVTRFKAVTAAARAMGPYLLVELVLPGGTLVALLMWLAQQWRRNSVTQ